MTNIMPKPFKAVDFNEKAIRKVIEESGSVTAEVKYDGVRGCIVVTPEGVTFLSRVGKTIPALSWLDGFNSAFDKVRLDDRNPFRAGFMIDCELMVKGVDFNTGAGLLRTEWAAEHNFPFNLNPHAEPDTKKSHKVAFELDPAQVEARVIAVLPLDAVVSGDEYAVNSALMAYHAANLVSILRDHKGTAIDWRMPEAVEVFDYDDLEILFREKRAEGHEGLIIKDPLCNYKRGKKSGWFKLKPNNEADGHVVGVVWGTEGLSNEGKVIGFDVLLESGRVVSATNISRTLMDEFTANVKKDPEFYRGYAVQITYMEETPDGSLRHPSFDKFRGTEADPCTKM